MTKNRFQSALVALLVLVFSLSISPQKPQPMDRADTTMLNRIWEEGITRSQIMTTLSYLADVIGPRIPASPAMKKASDWTAAKFTEWGMSNIAVEPAGEFGLGWSNDYVSIHLIEPAYQPILAYPVPWTSGTQGKIIGQPVSVRISSPADFEKYRGKLKGAIVFTQPPRQVHPRFRPIANRYSEADLKELQETPIPVKPKDRAGLRPGGMKWEELEAFYKSEEVGLLVESSSASRSDYGTVKVDAYDAIGKNHTTPDQNPRIIMAAEHYARICRIMDHNVPVKLEIEVRNTLYGQDRQGYNVVAEIPGGDKKDEVVMLGGHLDSWAAGTGAVDNAAGCAVTMEAMRILKTLGIRPRRTIRAALWTGEEEGFYGSRGYVFKHFGDTDIKSLEKVDFEAYESSWRNPLPNAKKLLVTPDYYKISGYFNYDNGSGRIKGIYIQENFQVRPIFEEWMKPLQDLGVSTIALQPTEGTDHLPFDFIGIPGFQFIQDPLDYVPQLHHTNQDIFDHCVPEDLIQSAIVMTYFVYQTAMREEMLPRKPLSMPVEMK